MAQAYVYEDDVTGWRLLAAGDLPASGVGAGTYGDGTHVAQVTVDSKGLVTAASNVLITAGSGITALQSSGGTITVTNPNGPTANVDLPASGVAAATYGSAANVAQVTVDAEGRVTAASNVAISGIGGGGFGLVSLFDSTLGGAAASIDTGANGIASGHGDLIVIVYARMSEVQFTSNLSLQFNGDTGSNYDFYYFRNINGTTGIATGHAVAAGSYGAFPAASTTANYFGVCRFTIPLYSATTAGYKVSETTYGIAADSDARSQTGTIMNTWRSTAAINQIKVFSASGGNLITGSRLVIYGTY